MEGVISQPCPQPSRSPGRRSEPPPCSLSQPCWTRMFCAGLAGPWAVGAVGQVPLHLGTGRLCLLRPRPASLLLTLSVPFSSCTFSALRSPHQPPSLLRVGPAVQLPLCNLNNLSRMQICRGQPHLLILQCLLLQAVHPPPRPSRPFGLMPTLTFPTGSLYILPSSPADLFSVSMQMAVPPHVAFAPRRPPLEHYLSLPCVFKSCSSSSLVSMVPSTPSVSCMAVRSLSPSTLSRLHR